MSEFSPFCPDCFHDKGHVQICPHCGWDDSEAPIETVLKPGTSLHHGQYLIGRVLGKPGGFGITYLGFDTRLEIKVAIKEYFPRECIRKHDHATVSAPTTEAKEFRVALDGFMKEARTVAKLKHANIVRVNNFFEENGTGYLVMDYYEGLTLAEYLQSKGGKLTEPTALATLMPILDGLREAHQAGILHRDIKPQNIYLTTGNQPILLDFGAARPIVRRDASLQATIGLYTPGYSPFEQQMTNGKQGPWTDVYACAATLYHMVTGECPPPAGDRILDGDPLIDPAEYRVTAKLSAILVKALAVKPEGRYQTIAEFQDGLTGNQPQEPDEDSEVTVVSCPTCGTGNRIPKSKSLADATCGKCGNKLRPEVEEFTTASCRSCGTSNRISKNTALQEAKCGNCGKGLGAGRSDGWKWALGIGGVLLVIVLFSVMRGEKEAMEVKLEAQRQAAAADAQRAEATRQQEAERLVDAQRAEATRQQEAQRQADAQRAEATRQQEAQRQADAQRAEATRQQEAQALASFRMEGQWAVNFSTPDGTSYDGYVRVNERNSNGISSGIMELSYRIKGEYRKVRQDATVMVEGNKVSVHCINPVVLNRSDIKYNADTFFLTVQNSKLLKGHTKDMAGTTGAATFTR